MGTDATTAIHGSPWKMLGLGVLGIGMTALSAVIAVAPPFLASVGLFGRTFGVIGALFFGLCTVLIFWRAITSTGAVVTLSPTGLRDVRVASEEIPWSAIRGISTWAFQGQKIMVLDVDPKIEAGLGLSAIARMTHDANRLLGADGLCVASQGLGTSYASLLAITTAYLAAHGSSADMRH
ncbi:MAG: STM3941 family protein [Hyphomicrobiaceae bacterium]